MDSKPLLEVTPIVDGLWRWTVPHPEWTPKNDRPDGWARMVGSVYFESPAGESDALVLVDPLAPPAGSAEAETFWSALDKDVDHITGIHDLLLTELGVAPARDVLA